MNYSISIAITMILFSAFFSGMEIAFLSSNKLRLELERKKGRFMARVIAIFTHNPRQYIATMLVGNCICLVVFGLVTARLLEPLIAPYFSSHIYVYILQTIISTLIILITAEFLPKLVFMLVPNLALRLFALPTLFFYVLFYPVTTTTNWLSYLVLKIFRVGFNRQTGPYVFDKADFDNLLQEVQSNPDENKKEEYEIKVLQNALDFSKVKLRNCMVPRTEVVAVDVENSIEEIIQAFTQSGFSKILAYKDNIDNIVGYFSSKDLFDHPENIRSKIITPVIVPETMSANKLLRILMQEFKSLAVVVDEFGGTAGIVTIEDIIEEIFGEIEDEHDTEQYTEKLTGENQYLFSARLSAEHLNSRYDIGIPESEEYETLSGYILHTLQRIPHANESFTIHDFEIKIVRANKNKIELVALKVLKDRLIN